MKKGTLLILALALSVWACEKGLGPTSGPTSLEAPPTAEAPGGSSSPTNPAVVDPWDPKGCDLVQLNRSSIKEETDCKKGVRFYAEATVTAGTGYFNVHLGGLNNGPILGPNQLNTWSKWYSLEEGSYTYTLAAETEIYGHVEQCDIHNRTFTIECYTGCIKPLPPQCEFGPAIYSSKGCTYTCPPCILPPPPGCEFGDPTPHPVVCSWVCPPCPVLECEEGFTFNTKTCQCECTLECLPNYHLHPETCDCWCDPIGEPECPEQTWNEETCSWVGECPPECEPPAEQCAQLSPGPPREECAQVGLCYCEGTDCPETVLWINKCGTDYQLTHEFYGQDTCECGPGHEVSHRTPCVCCVN